MKYMREYRVAAVDEDCEDINYRVCADNTVMLKQRNPFSAHGEDTVELSHSQAIQLRDLLIKILEEE